MHLYTEYQCEAQIGGSDQWGNLTSGTELIRRSMDDAKVFGITSPLITNSDGSKFGKSEGKNIWLSAERTSPYAFYQYWLNVADADVIDFMKRLSLKSPSEIQSFEAGILTEAHLRKAQKALEEFPDIAHWHGQHSNSVHEATLLVENDRYKDFAGLIVIETPEETRKTRLFARDGTSPEQATRILAAQLRDEDRRKAATEVIVNAGTSEELRTKVADFLARRGWVSSG